MAKYDAIYATCDACGSLHVVSPSWLAEAYANPIAADQLDDGAAWRNEVLAAATMLLGQMAPEGAWLDYGCGQGLLLRKLRALGRAVDGYDPYRGMTVGDGRRYSLITAYEVLEHQTDPRGFMLDVRRRMAPGGMLILSTCLRLPGHGPQWNYLALQSGQHVAFPSHRGMDVLVRNVGLTWWTTGICMENSDLQIHVFSDRPTDPEVFGVLERSGFTAGRNL